MQIALIYADRLETESLYSVQKTRLEQIERCLRAHAWSVVRIPRSGIPESLDSFDLVIAAGGDGTQLDAARRMRHVPLCALRLFPESSIGYHCTVDYGDFEAYAERLANRSVRECLIPRLQCMIDGTAIDYPILNDVLVAHRSPVRASRYVLSFGGVHQSQCSSGIWIATQPGSHGAAKSAGAMPLNDDEAGMAVFRVRELPDRFDLVTGTFRPGTDEFIVECAGNNIMLFMDGGLYSCPFSYGQRLTLCEYPVPLKKWI